MKEPNGSIANGFSCEFRSHMANVDFVCREIQSLLETNGLSSVCFPAGVVARECLNNAIVHGNRSDVDKKVVFKLRIGRKWICLQVLDEGNGFPWRQRTRRPLPEGAAVQRRGLSMCDLYADRISFSGRGSRFPIGEMFL